MSETGGAVTPPWELERTVTRLVYGGPTGATQPGSPYFQSTGPMPRPGLLVRALPFLIAPAAVTGVPSIMTASLYLYATGSQPNAGNLIIPNNVPGFRVGYTRLDLLNLGVNTSSGEVSGVDMLAATEPVWFNKGDTFVMVVRQQNSGVTQAMFTEIDAEIRWLADASSTINPSSP